VRCGQRSARVTPRATAGPRPAPERMKQPCTSPRGGLSVPGRQNHCSICARPGGSAAGLRGAELPGVGRRLEASSFESRRVPESRAPRRRFTVGGSRPVPAPGSISTASSSRARSDRDASHSLQGVQGALNDLAGGHIDLMSSPIPMALPVAQGGRVRMLGVTTKERVGALPMCRRSPRSACPATTRAPGSCWSPRQARRRPSSTSSTPICA